MAYLWPDKTETLVIGMISDRPRRTVAPPTVFVELFGLIVVVNSGVPTGMPFAVL